MWILISTGGVVIIGLLVLLIVDQKKIETKKLLLLEPLVWLTKKYTLVRYLGDQAEAKKLFGYFKGNLFQHDSLTEELLRQIEHRPEGGVERVEIIDCKVWPLLGETKVIQLGKRRLKISLAQISELSKRISVEEDILDQAQVLAKNGYLVMGIASTVVHSIKNDRATEGFVGAIVLEPTFDQEKLNKINKLREIETIKFVTVVDKYFVASIYEKVFGIKADEVATTHSLDKELTVKSWEAQARSAQIVAEADLKTRYHLARFFLHKDNPSLLSGNPEDRQLPLRSHRIK